MLTLDSTPYLVLAFLLWMSRIYKQKRPFGWQAEKPLSSRYRMAVTRILSVLNDTASARQ